MKILKTILATSILVMAVASCGNSKPVAVEPTATTVELGDCSEAADTMWEQYQTAIAQAWENDKGNFGTNVQNAFEDERQFIRRLNIPFMQSQQIAFVNAYTNLIDSYNIYWANPTNSNWLQLNRFITSHEDAYHNFRDTWNPLCDDDYPYPDDLFITSPLPSNLP